jgi:hypothetical protein
VLIANNIVTSTRFESIRESVSDIVRSRLTVTHVVESKVVVKQKKRESQYISDMTTYQKQ